MAGDWIKLEHATFEKPEVIAIAEELGISEQCVVGCLSWLWCWFDTQTENGNAPNVSPAFVNRRVGVSGFAEAMLSTGWLELSTGKSGGLSMPNFDRHNSKSAKKRALTARRVARHSANAASVSRALPREEKIYKPPTPLAVENFDGGESNTATPPKSPQGGTRLAKSEKGKNNLNGEALARIRNARGPDQLQHVMRTLGIGDGPAGASWQEAQAWAIKAMQGNRNESS